MAFLPGQPGLAGTRRINRFGFCWSKRWWGGSGISWTICKSFAPCSRQITTPGPHHSIFLQAGCPSCRPTNSVKALKAMCKMTSLIKPEVHDDIFHCRLRRTEPWPQATCRPTENFVNFGRVVFEICERTDTLITTLCSLHPCHGQSTKNQLSHEFSPVLVLEEKAAVCDRKCLWIT